MSRPFTIAHFSDPHIMEPAHAWRDFLNVKQLLGLANWFFKRRKIHKRGALEKAMEMIMERSPDVVVVTGDICQLAITNDYYLFRKLMMQLARKGMPVLIMRGNHDCYGRRTKTIKAFERVRRAVSGSLKWDGGVIRIGPVDFIPVDGAQPTPIFHCWGDISLEDIAGLEKNLEALPETGDQVKIAMGHFPLLLEDGTELPNIMALKNSKSVLDMLVRQHVSAYLCGHIHLPFVSKLPGGVIQHCAGTITGGGNLNIFKVSEGALHLSESIQLEGAGDNPAFA